MPVTPKDAATILLVRDHPSLEVLMVERHSELAFGPGALVYPGGKAEPEDADPEWERQTLGWFDLEPASRRLRICAVREAFEETGVLLGPAEAVGSDEAIEAAAQLRAALCRGEISFSEVLKRLGVVLNLNAVVPFARWITPSALAIRFDATFFIAQAPGGQVAACDGHEVIAAEWLTPKAALRLGDAGERQLMLPTRMTLKQLSQYQSGAEAIRAARSWTVVAQQRD